MDFRFPEEVWLIGPKGNIKHVKGTCVGIHDAVFKGRCIAAITDKYEILDRYANELHRDIIVFRKTSHLNWVFDNMILWPILIRQSIEATAIDILNRHGVKHIHLVGIDRMVQNDSDCILHAEHAV